jgi:hypothetical protein
MLSKLHSRSLSLIWHLVASSLVLPTAPFIPWTNFISKWRWNQGEHLIVIAPTGMGKTVMDKRLLQVKEKQGSFICGLVTKPVDDELSEMTRRKYMRVKDNKNWSRSAYPRLLLWPDAGSFSDLAIQRRVFIKALEGMWQKGKWVIMLNEIRYLTDQLKLKQEINTLYLQSRSSKVTLTGETQRPRNVPLEAFSQSTHVFFGPCRDDEDLKRISGIGNADPKLVRVVVQGLQRYQFAYVNAVSGEVIVTKTRPFAKVA